MTRLTHLDEQGKARMVDVGGKADTHRVAVAGGHIAMSAEALGAIRDGQVPKGDVIAAARIAGIMAAKRTAELIPLCHPLPLDAVTVDFTLGHDGVSVTASASLTGIKACRSFSSGTDPKASRRACGTCTPVAKGSAVDTEIPAVCSAIAT